MKTKGRENPTWGFTNPIDGWHAAKFIEGTDYMKDENGAIRVDSKGFNKLIFPLQINEESEDNEKKVSIILSEGADWAEQRLADMMSAAGLYGEIEKAYPGDVSFFDPKVMNGIKSKALNFFIGIRTETTHNKKDGKEYSNIVEICSFTQLPEKLATYKAKASSGPMANQAGGKSAAAAEVKNNPGW